MDAATWIFSHDPLRYSFDFIWNFQVNNPLFEYYGFFISVDNILFKVRYNMKYRQTWKMYYYSLSLIRKIFFIINLNFIIFEVTEQSLTWEIAKNLNSYQCCKWKLVDKWIYFIQKLIHYWIPIDRNDFLN